MNTKDTVILQTLRTAKSNMIIHDFRVGGWRGQWKDNNIVALHKYKHDKNNLGGVHKYLDQEYILGYLVDVATIASDIIISTKNQYYLYEADKSLQRNLYDPSSDIDNVLAQARGAKVVEDGRSEEDFPVRINEKWSENYHANWIALTAHILSSFGEKTLKDRRAMVGAKLLNYWRRGFDLKNFAYDEESFLAHYKILEYFEKRGTGASFGERVITGAGITKDLSEYYSLLGDFQAIRNNLDVAHTRVSKIPAERNPGLYFGYISGVWDYHDDLQEISRLLLLNFLGVPNLMLVSRGGLLQLQLGEKETE